MKNNKKPEFYTLEQLDSLIDVPIDDFSGDLDRYIDFKGLLYDESGNKFFAEGVFIISGTTKPEQQYTESEYSQYHDEFIDFEVLTNVTADKNCNDEALIGRHFRVKTQHYIKQDLYCYEQVKNLVLKMGAKFLDIENKSGNKTFNYNTQQVNQKSLFTLKEALNITCNVDERYALFSSPKLLEHTLQILCDCVKNQNGSGFHLITKELWSRYYCDTNNRYENGPCDIHDLTARSKIDIENTLISKSEFLRWCKFMNIETGLTEDVVVENESVEYSKFEIARLTKQVAELSSSLLEQVSAAPAELTSAHDVGENRIKTRTTQETLLISLALMAWMFVEKNVFFKKGSIPNSKKIMTAIENAIIDLELIDPDNDDHKILISNIDRDISRALKHLSKLLEK